eukprot:TRINITY_DN297_c0_g1_i11.p1 TRINITY_DN297_c0_g1~~TRINITY_DN297_c0_g1_i11.p1  ORF type:complete len:119 (+),score=21.52 TRINITY_DN297_c0_g1_i11:192-548(+)
MCIRDSKKAKRINKAFFASSSGVGAAVAEPAAPSECPLDVEELGNATWRFLHTTAAYYPLEPTETQKQSAVQLIHSLAQLYPCPICAPDFREAVSNHPPQVASRKEFVMCRLTQLTKS